MLLHGPPGLQAVHAAAGLRAATHARDARDPDAGARHVPVGAGRARPPRRLRLLDVSRGLRAGLLQVAGHLWTRTLVAVAAVDRGAHLVREGAAAGVH